MRNILVAAIVALFSFVAFAEEAAPAACAQKDGKYVDAAGAAFTGSCMEEGKAVEVKDGVKA